MALVSIYQGDTRTLVLQFYESDQITPINVSGFLVQGIARATYVSDAILNTTVTGIAPYAVTGTVFFPITTGDSSNCPGDYLFDFRVTDLFTGRSTYSTDGLRISPTTIP